MKTITLNKKDIHKGSLILINAQNPLATKIQEDQLSFLPTRKPFPQVLMERGAATILSHIMNAIHCGDEIIPVSGYRCMQEQEQIYADSLRENGDEFTKKYVAVPNRSEHQTGLAIDLGLNQGDIDFIRPHFPNEGICKEFRKKAVRFGFVERYPRGKETITGIAHEPWHFRYVGFPHSLIMSEKGLTLEEYIEYLKLFPYDRKHLITERNGQMIEIYYIPSTITDALAFPLSEYELYQISGNNVDGFIITLWR